MISREGARRIAAARLEALAENTDSEFVILDDQTIERPFGWVFFYDSAAHLKSGRFRDTLLDNGPMIVDRRDGSLRIAGTAYSAEWYIENYEKYGSPLPPEGEKRKPLT